MRYYRSKLGEVKSYAEWEKWTDDFFATLPKFNTKQMMHANCPKPDDWFERITKILKLEEVEVEAYEHE